MSRQPKAYHCGGFRLVRGNPPTIVDVHGRACRSLDGLCACPCRACVKARQCKHDQGTCLSAGSIQPFMPELRFETGYGRAKLADGTDYVGPIVTARPSRPDESALEPISWHDETCVVCGMRLSVAKQEEPKT